VLKGNDRNWCSMQLPRELITGCNLARGSPKVLGYSGGGRIICNVIRVYFLSGVSD
jgi:hypothetical protein